jgi:hypothetical protein
MRRFIAGHQGHRDGLATKNTSKHYFVFFVFASPAPFVAIRLRGFVAHWASDSRRQFGRLNRLNVCDLDLDVRFEDLARALALASSNHESQFTNHNDQKALPRNGSMRPKKMTPTQAPIAEAAMSFSVRGMSSPDSSSQVFLTTVR